MSKRDTHVTLSQIADNAQHAQDLCVDKMMRGSAVGGPHG